MPVIQQSRRIFRHFSPFLNAKIPITITLLLKNMDIYGEVLRKGGRHQAEQSAVLLKNVVPIRGQQVVFSLNENRTV